MAHVPSPRPPLPRAPWYVFVLVILAVLVAASLVGGAWARSLGASLSSDPDVRAADQHLVLLIGGVVVMLMNVLNVGFLIHLSTRAVWSCLAVVVVAIVVAVADVGVTQALLPGPVISLAATALLSLAAALACLQRLARTRTPA